jgi:prepilin-type processing-associated H-X9-DG protein
MPRCVCLLAFCTGEFRSGKRHGRGVCIDAEGDEYDGQWQNNKRHGYGVLRDSLNGVYRGQFADGVRNGAGTYLWPDGHVDLIKCEQNVRVGTGVGYSIDKRRVWILQDGLFDRDTTLEDAKRIAEELGLTPPV